MLLAQAELLSKIFNSALLRMKFNCYSFVSSAVKYLLLKFIVLNQFVDTIFNINLYTFLIEFLDSRAISEQADVL